jgi:hypothetical protein
VPEADFTSDAPMGGQKIPVIVLGGSDRKSTELPASVKDKHPLSGCKGRDILIAGRPMVQVIVDRLERSGCFDPIYLAGPADVYRPLNVNATLINTDGTFGGNIEHSLEQVRAAHPGLPVSFITCDILPEVTTLQRLVERYREDSPCDLWFPLPLAPNDPRELGAFAWKPIYRIVPRKGEPAVRILPGHFVVVDPQALRLKFLYRLFQVGYKTRNRPVDNRRSAMVRNLIVELLYQDMLHVLGLRLPNLTWSVLRAGIPAGGKLRDGTLTLTELEDVMRRIFVRNRHRRRYPQRRIVVPLVDAISLGLDVDTEEEAREIGA